MIAAVLLILAKVSTLLACLVLVMGGLILHLRRRLKQLWLEANQDPLTGLPNRRGLEKYWALAKGEQALLFIDLDGFKAVNDRWGHMVGDALLRQVANRLASVVAPPGKLARWGGDEFVAVVPAERVAVQQALLANAAVMAYDLSAAGGPPDVRVGISAGSCAGEVDLAAAVATANAGLMRSRSERLQ